MDEKKSMSSEEDVLNSEEFEKMYITAGNYSSNYTSILFLYISKLVLCEK